MVPDPLDPANQSADACARRLRLTAQLSDDGIAMVRERFRRENPDLTEPDLSRLISQWLASVPPTGFAEGWTVFNPSRFEL